MARAAPVRRSSCGASAMAAVDSSERRIDEGRPPFGNEELLGQIPRQRPRRHGYGEQPQEQGSFYQRRDVLTAPQRDTAQLQQADARVRGERGSGGIEGGGDHALGNL